MCLTNLGTWINSEFELSESCKIICVHTDWYDKELNVFYLDCYCTHAFFLETGVTSSLIVQEFWTSSNWSGLKILPWFLTCFLLCRHQWMQKGYWQKKCWTNTSIYSISAFYKPECPVNSVLIQKANIIHALKKVFSFSSNNTGCATVTFTWERTIKQAHVVLLLHQCKHIYLRKSWVGFLPQKQFHMICIQLRAILSCRSSLFKGASSCFVL